MWLWDIGKEKSSCNWKVLCRLPGKTVTNPWYSVVGPVCSNTDMPGKMVPLVQ